MAGKEKKGIIAEFKEFVSRGNVMDMAVGVIVATAFGKITTSLVNDVFMPFIGWVFGGGDAVQALNVTLSPAVLNDAGEVVTEAVVIGFGSFIGTIIDFVIVAFVVFMVIKTVNRARDYANERKQAELQDEPAAEEAAEPSEQEKLLTEIRDLIKNQSQG